MYLYEAEDIIKYSNESRKRTIRQKPERKREALSNRLKGLSHETIMVFFLIYPIHLGLNGYCFWFLHFI